MIEVLKQMVKALEAMQSYAEAERKGLRICDEAIQAGKQAIKEWESQEPVAWKWHKAPVKTEWGDDMVVADISIDKDHTVSIYCERDQTTKVEKGSHAEVRPLYTHPPQRTEQLKACVYCGQLVIKEKNT